MTETARLADQIRRTFEGAAWHGDPLLKILAGVNAATATAHPINNAHSIWELVLHIAAWDDIVRRRASDQKCPQYLGTCAAHRRLGRCCSPPRIRQKGKTHSEAEFSAGRRHQRSRVAHSRRTYQMG